MALFSLPNEILFEIVDNLDQEEDISSLIRVHTRLYNLFDDYLYGYDTKYQRGERFMLVIGTSVMNSARSIRRSSSNISGLTLKAKISAESLLSSDPSRVS